jgi:hypothetical protein
MYLHQGFTMDAPHPCILKGTSPVVNTRGKSHVEDSWGPWVEGAQSRLQGPFDRDKGSKAPGGSGWTWPSSPGQEVQEEIPSPSYKWQIPSPSYKWSIPRTAWCADPRGCLADWRLDADAAQHSMTLY